MTTNNIEQEIKDLQIKIAALEQIWEDQDIQMDTSEYELEQLNKGIETLKARKDNTQQSYLNIIERERMAKVDTYQLIQDLKKEQGYL